MTVRCRKHATHTEAGSTNYSCSKRSEGADILSNSKYEIRVKQVLIFFKYMKNMLFDKFFHKNKYQIFKTFNTVHSIESLCVCATDETKSVRQSTE